MRIQSLAEAEGKAETCRDCSLWEGARNLVYDDGCHNADLMLIGEAPGRQEDEQGKPFVGDAGQLLNGMFREIGIRREDVYIANVIKHRPPSNRDPYAGEIKELVACCSDMAPALRSLPPYHDAVSRGFFADPVRGEEPFHVTARNVSAVTRPRVWATDVGDALRDVSQVRYARLRGESDQTSANW